MIFGKDQPQAIQFDSMSRLLKYEPIQRMTGGNFLYNHFINKLSDHQSLHDEEEKKKTTQGIMQNDLIF